MVGSAQYVVGVDAKNLQVVRDQLCVQRHIRRAGFITANWYIVYRNPNYAKTTNKKEQSYAKRKTKYLSLMGR